jgi:hypothetical protein
VSVIALRFAYLVALAVWLGGMIALGFTVAPSLFQTLPSLSPENGRAFAGDTFKVVLTRFHTVEYACGGTAIVALVVMALLGPRPRHFSIRALTLAVMLGVSIYSGRRVLGGIDAIQAEVGTLPSRLPAGDARRVPFRRAPSARHDPDDGEHRRRPCLLGWEAADQQGAMI